MNLNELTIREAHHGLKNKKFSSVELTQACLKRAKELNSTLNAYTLITEEKALEMAKKADEVLQKNENPNPLTGIPCAVKDSFCTEGVRTTACSNILRNFIPPYDAVSVKKLKETSMVMLGKTNTDEFTCGASTETSCFGVTKNPWNLKHVSGGSSGGSATAVATDACIYALGTDTGGSIRQPASFCGITGLKVTYGRVSRFGVIAMASSLDTIGSLAKDVFDIALVMNIIAGKDYFDSTTPDKEVPDYTKGLDAPDLKGLKIGLPDEYFVPGMEEDVEKRVKEAVKELEKAGAQIQRISLPHTKYACACYYIICPSEVSANMARYDGIRFGPGTKRQAEDLFDYYLKVRDEGFGDEMKRRIMIGTYALSAGYYEAYYLKAQQVRTLIKMDFENAFREVDAICCPVAPTTAFEIGEKTSDPVLMYLGDIFTIPANLAGVPALAVPCGFNKLALPVGMQIIGPQFEEPLILRIGSAYQKITDWHKKHPKIS